MASRRGRLDSISPAVALRLENSVPFILGRSGEGRCSGEEAEDVGEGPNIYCVVQHLPPYDVRLVASQVAELHGHGVALLQSQDGFELLGMRADVLPRSTVLYLAGTVSGGWVPLVLPGCHHVALHGVAGHVARRVWGAVRGQRQPWRVVRAECVREGYARSEVGHVAHCDE